jgi:hypothetical protein
MIKGPDFCGYRHPGLILLEDIVYPGASAWSLGDALKGIEVWCFNSGRAFSK